MLRTPRRRRILAFDRGGPVWPPRSNAPAGRERNETKKTKNKKDFIKKGLFDRGEIQPTGFVMHHPMKIPPDTFHCTHVPEIQATRNTSYLTASKSLNGRKIARMAPILTIFGPNRSQRRNLFFEKFSNERRRHRGIVVVVIVAVVVAVVVIGRFWVACIKGTSLGAAEVC